MSRDLQRECNLARLVGCKCTSGVQPLPRTELYLTNVSSIMTGLSFGLLFLIQHISALSPQFQVSSWSRMEQRGRVECDLHIDRIADDLFKSFRVAIEKQGRPKRVLWHSKGQRAKQLSPSTIFWDLLTRKRRNWANTDPLNLRLDRRSRKIPWSLNPQKDQQEWKSPV